MTCCSGWHVLGRVNGPDRRSLREIWDGPERTALYDALAVGDFELGCFECGRLAGAGQRADSLARHFDRYDRLERRRYPVMIDFALSNRCNLQCVQCSGSFSSAIRTGREHRPPLPPAYDERFFEELDEFLPHLVRAQFKGGEPFLTRQNRRIWDRFLTQPVPPEICVTTNGTVWNDQVERYVTDLAFDVIVSVDAVDPEVLAGIRVGVDPERLWANVDRFRAVTRSTGRGLTLSFCLMSLNWHQLAGFLRRNDELGVRPDVIWVDGPGEVNLLTMAAPALEEALKGLEAADAAMSDLSRQSRSIWDDAIGRVRAQVEDRSGSGVAVEVSATRWRGGPGEDRLVLAAEELRAGNDGPLLSVTYVGDVIAAVEPDAWSDWLHPASWIGSGLDETMVAIATDAGGTMRSRVESIEGGAHRIELTFEHPDGDHRLQGVHVPDRSTPGASHLLLVDTSPVRSVP